MAVTRVAAPADRLPTEAQGGEPGLGVAVRGLAGLASAVVVLGWATVVAGGDRGALGALWGQSSAGVTLGLVLVGFVAGRPYVRAAARGAAVPGWWSEARRWLLLVVPTTWAVIAAAHLLAPAAGGELPTQAFSPVSSGVTSVPLAAIVRDLTATQSFGGNPLEGPTAHLWPVAASLLFVTLVLPAAVRLARRPLVAAAGLFVAGWLTRLAILVVGPSTAAATTTVLAQLDRFALGLALAALAGRRLAGAGRAGDPRTDAAAGADQPRPGAAGRLAAEVRRLAGAPLAPPIGAATAVVVLVATALVLDLPRTATVVGGGRGTVEALAQLLAVAALAGPVLVRAAAVGPVGPGARATAIARWSGRLALPAYLWAPLVLGRWASAAVAEGRTPLPARHPGRLFHLPIGSTLAWTVVVTGVLAVLTWAAIARPWARRVDRPLSPFVSGLWVIALASYATRIWSFATATARDPGNGDPFYYHAQANMLADGVGFGEPIRWLTEGRFVPTAIHPPLFTLWLTPASLLGARSFLAHKALAAVAGVAVVVVAGLLARRLAGDRAGLVAAALAALYPNLWIIDGTLWPEGLYTAMVGAALLAAYHWADRPSWGRAALLGAAVGGAVLARGEALALLPVLCLPLAWSARDRVPRWPVHAAVMGAVALGVLAPWTIRNAAQFEDPVLVSTNSQEVLYYANCPESYDGPLIGYWSFNCQVREQEARVARGEPADPPGDEAAEATAWGRMGRAYALDHKDRWPAVVAARVTRVWDLQHADNNVVALQFEGRPRDWSERGLLVYRLLLVPAVAGLVILRRRRVTVWPLLAMVGMVTAIAAAVYGHIRFRTVGDLVIVVGAAVALDALLTRVRPAIAGPPTDPDAASRSTMPDTDQPADAPGPAAPSDDSGRAPAAEPRPSTTPVAVDGSVDVPEHSSADRRGDADAAEVAEDEVGEDGSPPAWARLRPDRWTIAAVGLVALAFILPLRALFRYQGPPMEEGFMLVFPEQVLNGQVPHKDFLHLYGPGSLWALAGWYEVLGVSITAERIFGAVQLAGVVGGVMALARPWGRRVVASVGLVGVLLTTTAIGLTALAWDGAVALAVASVWVGLRARRWLTDAPGVAPADAERRADRLLVGAGLLAGLALLFRPDVIVAVVLASLAVGSGLGWARKRRWVIGAAVGVLPYLYLIATAGLGNAVSGMLLEPVFELRDGRSLPRPPSLDRLDGALQKVAALREAPWPVPALGSPAQTFVWFFLLPAVVLFVVGVGWWRVRAEPDAWRPRVLLAVGLLGLGLMPQALQRPDSTHLAWVSCVPLAFLPAAIAELLRHLGPRPIRRHAPSFAAVGVLLVPLLLLPNFTTRTWVDLVEQGARDDVFGYQISQNGRRFYLGSEEIAVVAQRMLDEVAPQMAPGQRLFVGTADLRQTPYSDAYLYYLLPDQVPGTRYIEMDPGMANAPDSGLADEVATSDWLILSHIWDVWIEPNGSQDLGSDAPNQVVRRDFCPVGDYAPYFEVYRRCEDA